MVVVASIPMTLGAVGRVWLDEGAGMAMQCFVLHGAADFVQARGDEMLVGLPAPLTRTTHRSLLVGQSRNHRLSQVES